MFSVREFVRHVTVDLYNQMTRLDSDTLVKYTVDARKLLQIVLVLLRIDHKQYLRLRDAHMFVEQQDASFQQAADSLYQIHREILSYKIPNADILTAIDVLTTGKYQRLPLVVTRRFVEADVNLQVLWCN
jgi:hypothetical protein